jgi:hypothetical protein
MDMPCEREVSKICVNLQIFTMHGWTYLQQKYIVVSIQVNRKIGY